MFLRNIKRSTYKLVTIMLKIFKSITSNWGAPIDLALFCNLFIFLNEGVGFGNGSKDEAR